MSFLLPSAYASTGDLFGFKPMIDGAVGSIQILGLGFLVICIVIVGLQIRARNWEHIMESVGALVVALCLVLGAPGIVSAAKALIPGAQATSLTPMFTADAVEDVSSLVLYYAPFGVLVWQKLRHLWHGTHHG